MNIIDLLPDERSRQNFAAYYARAERRQRLLIRRQFSWKARKFHPGFTALLETRMVEAYRHAALSYMRSV